MLSSRSSPPSVRIAPSATSKHRSKDSDLEQEACDVSSPPPPSPGSICSQMLALLWPPFGPHDREKHPHAHGSKRSRFERARRLRLVVGTAICAVVLVCLAFSMMGGEDARASYSERHTPHRGFAYRAHLQGQHEHHDHTIEEHMHGSYAVQPSAVVAASSSYGIFERARSFFQRSPEVDEYGNSLLEPAWSGPDDSIFFDMPPEGGSDAYFCPCCGWQGNAFGIYNGRADAGCPVCGVSERHRFACYLVQTELQPAITAASDTRPHRFLHFNPTEQIVRRMDRVPNFDQILCDYRGGFPGLAHMELENFQLPTAFLDGLMMIHVLEHAENDKRALEEVSRVLKPDAWMIIEVPCHSNLEETVECLGEMSSDERATSCGHANHYRRYSCAAFRQQLLDAGFDCHLPRMTQDDLAKLTSHIIPKQFVCWRAVAEIDEEDAAAEVAEKYDGQFAAHEE